jgi:hypothetical protein
MNPAAIAIAGQNTAGSMLRSLFVVDMLYPSKVYVLTFPLNF